jgi:hypothetical protein
MLPAACKCLGQGRPRPAGPENVIATLQPAGHGGCDTKQKCIEFRIKKIMYVFFNFDQLLELLNINYRPAYYRREPTILVTRCSHSPVNLRPVTQMLLGYHRPLAAGAAATTTAEQASDVQHRPRAAALRVVGPNTLECAHSVPTSVPHNTLGDDPAPFPTCCYHLTSNPPMIMPP